MIEDIDRIMAVMEAAFDPRFGEAWNRRQVSDMLVMPGCRYLLAGECHPAATVDRTAGFTLSRRAADEEELLLIAVRPECRNQGVGSALLSRLAREASEDGIGRLFLEMREGNPAASLYCRHGFTPVGRRKNYYRRGAGTPYDAITFALDVQAA